MIRKASVCVAAATAMVFNPWVLVMGVLVAPAEAVVFVFALFAGVSLGMVFYNLPGWSAAMKTEARWGKFAAWLIYTAMFAAAVGGVFGTPVPMLFVLLAGVLTMVAGVTLAVAVPALR